jgi:hypothetical protein
MSQKILKCQIVSSEDASAEDNDDSQYDEIMVLKVQYSDKERSRRMESKQEFSSKSKSSSEYTKEE